MFTKLFFAIVKLLNIHSKVLLQTTKLSPKSRELYCFRFKSFFFYFHFKLCPWKQWKCNCNRAGKMRTEFFSELNSFGIEFWSGKWLSKFMQMLLLFFCCIRRKFWECGPWQMYLCSVTAKNSPSFPYLQYVSLFEGSTDNELYSRPKRFNMDVQLRI